MTFKIACLKSVEENSGEMQFIGNLKSLLAKLEGMHFDHAGHAVGPQAIKGVRQSTICRFCKSFLTAVSFLTVMFLC